MFSNQIEVLKTNYKIIAYDHRGQGNSEITDSGYDIDNLTTDAIELMNHLEINKFHFVGLSMGGFVGLRLASQYPDRVKSLVLINTSSDKTRGFKKFKFTILRNIVRFFGLKPVKGQLVKSFFGKTFLKDKNRRDEKKEWANYLVGHNKEGLLKAFEGAVNRPEFDDFSKITCATLVIGGEEDIALSAKEATDLSNSISSSDLIILAKTGHTSTIENPETINNALKEFFKKVT